MGFKQALRRLFSYTLAIAMVATMMPCSAIAEVGESVSNQNQEQVEQAGASASNGEGGVQDEGGESGVASGDNQADNAADSSNGQGADDSQQNGDDQSADDAEDGGDDSGNQTPGDDDADNGDQVATGGVYSVSTTAELSDALSKIAASDAAEATIVLKADVNNADFGGVTGKKVTVTSQENEHYTIQVAEVLSGDLVFDSVKCQTRGGKDLYANGHIFETTDRFQGFVNDDQRLYGGGPKGVDVEGDTCLILRGDAKFSYVTGGGLNSDVGGSTHILVDSRQMSTGNLTGGGRVTESSSTASVGGDTNIVLTKGWSGYLYGGGRNETAAKGDKELARVYGDTHITTGEENALQYQAYIGTAMASCGGSECSTVTNVYFTILPGTVNYSPDSSDFPTGDGSMGTYGAGKNDVVLGTVSVEVRDGGCGSRVGKIYGGGYGEGESCCTEVRNQKSQEYAIRIVYDNSDDVANTSHVFEDYEHGINAGSDGDVATKINGAVSLDVANGDFDYMVLDSYNNDAEVDGDATLHITGGRVAQIEGNTGHQSSAQYRSCVIYDGCGTADAPQESGYLYKIGQVTLENNAKVLIDGSPDVFSQFSSTQRPFYSVKDLKITGGSVLTTRNSTTTVLGSVSMEYGT